MTEKTTYHRDGTVTYWSVYEQRWVVRAEQVPDRELATMGTEERERIISHLASRERA